MPNIYVCHKAGWTLNVFPEVNRAQSAVDWILKKRIEMCLCLPKCPAHINIDIQPYTHRGGDVTLGTADFELLDNVSEHLMHRKCVSFGKIIRHETSKNEVLT